MIRSTLTHPEIIGALASAGHSSKVLVADANYPHSTRSNALGARVHLNLRRGQPSVLDVLETLMTEIAVEAATVMSPDSGDEPEIFFTYAQILSQLRIERLDRPAFYAAGEGRDVALMIVTGDETWYSNVLLTIGAIPPK